jgi:Domain of unknown function (DUF4865)
MYAIQCEIALPTDYDMQVIRDRVALKAKAPENLPGLELRAYLIREKANGAPRNEYAPFYVWTDVIAAERFLWGTGAFSGIVSDFGRPAVRTWLVEHVWQGHRHGTTPGWAIRGLGALDEDMAPDRAVSAALARFKATATANTHTQVLAIDPATWTVCEFALLFDRPADDVRGSLYQVLHISYPDSDET